MLDPLISTAVLFKVLELFNIAHINAPNSQSTPINPNPTSINEQPPGWNKTVESTYPSLHDPFYDDPPGFENAELGAILKHRPVPRNITFDNESPVVVKSATQIQYRTQNAMGEPVTSITTLLEPFNSRPDTLFSLAYFTDAAFHECNPSIALQVGMRADAVFTQQQTMLAVAAMSFGWFVSISDEAGTQGVVGSGPHTAYATLDGLRAVQRSSNFTGINPDPKISMLGYSGGAFAVGWTFELHPQYAPEVNLVGGAMGGVPCNITYLMETYNESPDTTLVPLTLLGLSHEYANMSQWLNENLVPEHAAEFRMAEHQCYEANEMYAMMDLGKFFKNGYASIFDEVPLSLMRHEAEMGNRGTPTAPLYVFQVEEDEVTPTTEVDKLVQKYCSRGAKVLYERNVLPIIHRYEFFFAVSGAVNWLKDRMEGKPADPGCKTETVTQNTWSGLSELIFVNPVLQIASAYFGMRVSGPEK